MLQNHLSMDLLSFYSSPNAVKFSIEAVSVTSEYPQHGGSIHCCYDYCVDIRLSGALGLECNRVCNVGRISRTTKVPTRRWLRIKG